MTREQILHALNDILATGTGDPEFVYTVDVKALRDELRRDLILFPKEEP